MGFRVKKGRLFLSTRTPKLCKATRDSRLIGKIAKGFKKNL